MRTIQVCCLLVLLTFGCGTPTPARKPVKVFVLAGQSNMEGQAVVDLTGKSYNDGKGTLAELMKARPRHRC